MRALNRKNSIASKRSRLSAALLALALAAATASAAPVKVLKLSASGSDRPYHKLDQNAPVWPTGGYLNNTPWTNTLRLSGDVTGIDGGWSGSLGFDDTERDETKIFVRDRRGSEIPLSQLPHDAKSYHGDFTLGKALANYDLNLNGRSSIGDDDFFTKSYGVSLKGTYLDRSLNVTLALTRQIGHQPPTTFLDRDFRTKYRPTRLISDNATLTFEQMINEANKLSLSLLLNNQTAERPRNLGLRLKSASALRPSVFLRSDLFAAREQRNRPLQNERGYFEMNSGALAVAWEAVYDLLLEAEATFIYEKEEDPRVDERRSLTSQVLALGVQVNRFNPGFDLSTAFTFLETKEIFYTLQGGISWTL